MAWKGSTVVVPHLNWRGLFGKGTDANGSASAAAIEWPGFQTTASHSRAPTQLQTLTWFGSVMEGQRDAGGQMYMRNRYYDPATGQFTQTDPIGIAGGLNTYGFANGDPVSYSDPYGLSADTLKYNGTSATLVGDDGKVRWSGAATSGQPGSTAADQNTQNFGPIPEGTYSLNPSDISTVSGWRYMRRGLSGITQGHPWSDWGNNRVRLTPSGGTSTGNRDDFFLHGGRSPGSLGCIDVGRGETALFNLLRSHRGNVTVVVSYPSAGTVTTPRMPDNTDGPTMWIK